MNIQNLPTPNVYELHQAPLVVVFHTTFGDFDSAVEWLRMTPEQRQAKTGTKSWSSAHAVFGRNDEVAKLAGANVGTWHAGAISKPSKRALSMLPKTFFGNLKNPNRASIGLEFACHYDVDRDGVLETWEKLYTSQQIENAAKYIIEDIEPEIKKYHSVEIEFSDINSCTHRDITSYKPNLEVQRNLVLAALKRQRAANVSPPTSPVQTPVPSPAPRPASELILESGDRLVVEKKGSDKIIIRKI